MMIISEKGWIARKYGVFAKLEFSPRPFLDKVMP
jgi:hypothetical protein